jgi:NitT/TauT family transport system permease protein
VDNPALAPVTPKGAKKARRGKRTSLLLRQVAFYLAITATWEVLGRVGVIDPFYLPAPSAIAQRFWQLLLTGDVLAESWVTFIEMLVGLVIGAVAGVGCGLAVVRVSWAWPLIQPLVYFTYSLPRIALAPLFIVALGLGIWSKIATVVFAVFFVLLLNTVAGANDVGREYVRAAKALGCTDGQVLRKVVIPGTLAWIFSGLRLSVSLAFLSAVVAEFVGSTGGLGYRLQAAATYFDVVGIYTWMFVLGTCAVLLSAIVSVAERRLLRWRPQPLA